MDGIDPVRASSIGVRVIDRRRAAGVDVGCVSGSGTSEKP